MNAVASEAKSEAHRGVVVRSACSDRVLSRQERLAALELAARQYPDANPLLLVSAAKKFATFVETGE